MSLCCEIVVNLDRSMTESLFYTSNIVIYIRLYEYVCMCQDLVLCKKVPLGVSGPLNSLNKRPWEYCWLWSLSWYCGCPMGDYCGTRPSVSRADSGKLVPRRLHTHITDTHHSNQTLFFAPSCGPLGSLPSSCERCPLILPPLIRFLPPVARFDVSK